MNFFRALPYVLSLGMTALVFTACDKDDDDNSVLSTGVEALSTLPTEARTLIFSMNNASVSNTKTYASVSQRGTKYESYVLVNNTPVEIEFDVQGNWTDIEGLNNAGIPERVLLNLAVPQLLLDYLKQNNDSFLIEEVERLPYGYQVELSNDREYVFDLSGNLIQTAGLGNWSNNVTPSTQVNALAKTFIDKHFSGYTIQLVKQDIENAATVYKYYIVNGLRGYKITFDASYNWVEVSGDDDRAAYLPTSVIQLLPQAVQNVLPTYSQGQLVESIDREVNRYEVELANGRTLYFSLLGEFQGYELD